MQLKKKGITSLFAAVAILSCITITAFAANTIPVNVETIRENEKNNIIITKDAEKEPDGISKVSADMGQTWMNEVEFTKLNSADSGTEYWTIEEYKVYAAQVDNDLVNMLADGEPELTQADIDTWRIETAQMLKFIKNGGKVSKDMKLEDSQLMISGMDNSLIDTITD